MAATTSHRVVRDAVVALLQAAPALCDGGVHANRRRPMAAQHTAQVWVFLEDAPASLAGILYGPIDWRTRLRIECAARGTPGGDSGEDAVDALSADVFARLQSDITLGGLVMALEPQGMAWAEDEADTTVAACQLMFEALHRTTSDSIAASPAAAADHLLLEGGGALLLESGDLMLME